MSECVHSIDLSTTAIHHTCICVCVAIKSLIARKHWIGWRVNVYVLYVRAWLNTKNGNNFQPLVYYVIKSFRVPVECHPRFQKYIPFLLGINWILLGFRLLSGNNLCDWSMMVKRIKWTTKSYTYATFICELALVSFL